MANDFGQELGSLNFENIIGGPLTAVVEAQALAAETSIDFINEIGLVMEEGETRPVTTVFSYQKRTVDEDGNVRMRNHSLKIPVLSIVPIPFMTFHDVWLDFNVNLNSMENRTHSSKTGGYFEGSGTVGKFNFSGHVAGSRHKKGVGQVSKNYSMGVKIHAVQDEMPEGMERVLNILEQLATAEIKPYNSVKQISLIAASAQNFIQDMDVEGTGAIVASTTVGGSGYGYTGSIDFNMPAGNRISALDLNSVLEMQERLNSIGITDFDGNILLVDDKLGVKTLQALWKLAADANNISATKIGALLGNPVNYQATVAAAEFVTSITNGGITVWNTSEFLKENTSDGNTDWSWITGTSDKANLKSKTSGTLRHEMKIRVEASYPSQEAIIRLTIPSDVNDPATLNIIDPGAGYLDTGDLNNPVTLTGVGTNDTISVNIGTTNGAITSAVLSPATQNLPSVQSVFTNVPLLSTSGIGVGAVASITITNDQLACTITSTGAGYEVGDTLVVDNGYLGGCGSGFQLTVTEIDQTQTPKETVYICQASGGGGTGLKVRVTLDANGNASATTNDIVDGGRDYAQGQIAILSNSNGSGTVEVTIEKVE